MRKRLTVIGLLVCLVSSGAWAIEWATYAGNWSDPNGWTISSVAAGRIPAGTDDVQIQGPNSVCTLNTSTAGWGQARLRVNTSGTLRVVDGGQLLGSSWFRVGSNVTTGTLIQTGGLVKITDGSDKAKLGIGDSAGAEGVYTISGGTLTTDSTTGALNVGARGGKGKFVVVGSKATILMNTLAVPESSGTPSGTLEFQVDSTGVSPIGVKSSVTLDPKGADSTAALVVSAIDTPPDKDIVLVDLQSTSAISGKFDTVNGAPADEGTPVVLSAGGRTSTYALTYKGGTGNDIVLVYKSSKTTVTTMISDFETGLNGWIPREWAPFSTFSTSTVGVTSGAQSLKAVEPLSGWQITGYIKFQNVLDPNALAAMTAAWLAAKTLECDVTIDPALWVGDPNTGWLSVALLSNSDKGGWYGFSAAETKDSVNPAKPGEWTAKDFPKLQTRHLSYDLTAVNAKMAAAGGPGGWFEVFLIVNSTGFPNGGTVYLDNVKLVGEVDGITTVDSFDTAHDFLTGGLAGFDGTLGTFDALNADVNRPGALFMQTTGAWWDPGPGPMLYKLVKGDFVATVKVVDFAGTLAAPVLNNDCGIVARDPNGAVENWVSVNYFPTWTAFVARNTIAGVRNELGQTAARWKGVDTYALAAQYPYIRLERKGADFFFRISKDGKSFVPLTDPPYLGIGDETVALVVNRPDLPATLQLGLVNATYDVTTGYAAFDDFTISIP